MLIVKNTSFIQWTLQCVLKTVPFFKWCMAVKSFTLKTRKGKSLIKPLVPSFGEPCDKVAEEFRKKYGSHWSKTPKGGLFIQYDGYFILYNTLLKVYSVWGNVTKEQFFNMADNQPNRAYALIPSNDANKWAYRDILSHFAH